MTPAALVKELQQHPQNHVHEVDKAVWSQPSHWAHSTPSSGQEPARADNSHMTDGI